MKTFTAGTGSLGANGWEPESSFLDPFTGKLTIQHGDGTQTIYDPADDTLTTRSTSRGVGLLSDNATDTLFQRVYDTVDGGVDSLISETTDSDGKSSTTLGTAAILSGGKTLLDQNATTGTTTIGDGSSAITVTGTGISKDGANLIGKTDDGAIHIGENSLVTVEKDGQQWLYATDGDGNLIPINITNGSDLLVNGVNVGTSLTTNTTNIATNSTNIATNSNDIATNLTNISTNTTHIATNTANVATHASHIAVIDTQVGELYSRADGNSSGVAMAMAMTGGSLPAQKTFAMSLNQGFFKGMTASAMSVFLRASDAIVISGGLAVGSNARETGGRVGMQMAW
jgi:hypothetical protein